MCSFKFLTFKFDFDIIKIEHRFLSFIVCLINYNFGAFYALFQYYHTFFRDEGFLLYMKVTVIYITSSYICLTPLSAKFTLQSFCVTIIWV